LACRPGGASLGELYRRQQVGLQREHPKEQVAIRVHEASPKEAATSLARDWAARMSPGGGRAGTSGIRRIVTANDGPSAEDWRWDHYAGNCRRAYGQKTGCGLGSKAVSATGSGPAHPAPVHVLERLRAGDDFKSLYADVGRKPASRWQK